MEHTDSLGEIIPSSGAGLMGSSSSDLQEGGALSCLIPGSHGCLVLRPGGMCGPTYHQALLASPILPSAPDVKRVLVGVEGGWTAKARVLMGAEGGAQPELLASGQGQGQRAECGL